MMNRLFRQRFKAARRSRGKRATELALETLEARRVLAYSVGLVTLTTEPVTYAYNIVLDDAVDSQGYGRDLYIRRGDDASPFALVADNPEFRDFQRLGLQLVSGPVSTFYVTTGGQQAEVFGTDLSPLPPGVLPVGNPALGLYTLTLPSENPLALNGSVFLAPGVSFTYSGVGLQANLPNVLTLTVNNATNWGSAGLNTSPTGRIDTLGGVSTLTFRLFDTNGVPVNSPGNFDLVNAPYLYFNPFPTNPFSFNVVAGQDFDQRLIVDLAGTGSRISLQSPWGATRGDNDGTTPGVDRDPFFYSAYSGLDATGQVALYASEVSVAQLLTATSTIDVGDARARSDRLTVTANLVRGSTVISNVPASTIGGIRLNDFVSGPGIAEGTQVIGIDAFASTITLSGPVAINATNVSVTFISGRPSGFIGVPYSFEVTAEMRAPALNVRVSGNDERDGTIFMAQSGRFTRDGAGAAAGAVFFNATDTDVYVEGWINAVSQNYLVRSSDSERQFDFTTRSRSTGATVGTIGGDILAANLGNLGGTTFDVRTQLQQLRIDSGVDLLGRPYRNAITVSEVEQAANPFADGNLIVSAVAASSGPIAIKTDNQLTFLGSAIRTSGDLVIEAGGDLLSLPATVTSADGNVVVRAPVVATGAVQAGGGRSVQLVAGQSATLATRTPTAAGSDILNLTSTARLSVGMLAGGLGIPVGSTVTEINGRAVTLSNPTTAASASGSLFSFVSVAADATLDAAVVAGGSVKQPVRVATNMPLPALAGLLSVDGVDLLAGDRVLVKNQPNAAQNGIYVVLPAAWARAADASLSTLLVPGFVVFAEEGETQEGGWCFSNSVNPIVGETGLTFEPVTAVRTYNEVRLATVANISLFGTAGLVDGRPVNIGDRVLVKDQTNPAENGVYVVTAGRWERADDADESSELTAGSYVAVERAGILLAANLTASSTTIALVTASTANLRAGMLVEGAGVLVGTLVVSVSGPNTVDLSQAVTTTGPSSLTFTAAAATDSGLFGTASLDGDLATGSPVVTFLSGAIGLTAEAVQPGMLVSGAGIPLGATVLSVDSATQITLSADATATATVQPLTFTALTTQAGSAIIGGLRTTTGLRPGMVVVGTDIPGGATIRRILGTASIELDQPATGTASGTPLAFFERGGVVNAGRGFALVNDALQVNATTLQFTAFVVQPTRTNLWSPQSVAGSVRVATTADIPLGGLQTIDGVAVQSGDRVLVKNQIDQTDNGIWLAAPGAWARAVDPIPRDTAVFVREGASGRGSTWAMNDAIQAMGQLTSGLQTVRGLASTSLLAAGMLVTGPGIQTGTTIELVIDSTSVRLSRPPLATDPNAVLSFIAVTPVVAGQTPLVFVPQGGEAAITAAGNIQSSTPLASSRIRASNTLLTAGRRPDGQILSAGVIDARVATGRLSMFAPESIIIDAAGTLDVIDARTTTSGAVTIVAAETLVTRSIITASATATPSPISLASELGDVVATTLATPLGDISLRADGVGRIFVRSGGPTDLGVTTGGGSIDISTDDGPIDVAGRVVAGGPSSDIAFRSASRDLRLAGTAVVQANDQLVINTPNGQLQAQPGASVAAARLAITAELGAQTSPPAVLGSFNAIEINRTDPGNISLVNPGPLTIEGASTVSGSIQITAPSVNVVGPVTAGTEAVRDGNVELTATTGSIDLAADVTARADTVRLTAPQGVITQTAGVIDAAALVWTATASPTLLPGNTFTTLGLNLTAPGDVRIPTSGSHLGRLELGRVTTVDGNIVVDADSVSITRLLQAGGAGKSVSVTARTGGISFDVLGRIEQPSGPVVLSAAAGAITNTNAIRVPNHVAAPNSLSLSALSRGELRTSVESLAATISDGNLVIDEADALVLAGVTARNIRVLSQGHLSQTAPIIGQFLTVGAGSVGGVLLDHPGNDVDRLTVHNAQRQVRFTDVDDLAITNKGIIGRNVVVTIGGNLRVDAPIEIDGNNLVLTSQAGNVILNGDLRAPGATVTISAAQGTFAQAAGTMIDSRVLIWYATAQPVLAGINTFTAVGINLTRPGDVRIPASGSRGGILEVAGASTVDGTIEVDADSVVISSLMRAGGAGKSVTITARTGDISFVNGGRIETASGAIVLEAVGGSVLLVNDGAVPVVITGGGLTVRSAGSVPVGYARATGPITVTSGSIDVGPQAYGLLESATSIDLRGVGTVAVGNGGRIVAPTVQLAPGRSVQLRGADNITTAAELDQAIYSVDGLPAIPGSPYELVVTASLILTQPLIVTRPIALRGNSLSVVLSGSPAVTSGLLLGPGSDGSSVRNIVFSGFAAEAIRLNDVQNIRVSGIRSASSGVGIGIYGNVTGTVVQGSTFDRNTTGVKLESAKGVLVGGNANGEANTISSSVREAVFANGFCSGSQVIKNRITGTATAYNTGGARGLTIIQ